MTTPPQGQPAAPVQLPPGSVDPQDRERAIAALAQWLRTEGVTDPAQATKAATVLVDQAIADGHGRGPVPG